MSAAQEAIAKLAETCEQHELAWESSWSAPLQRLLELVADGQARVNLVGDPSPAGVSEHVLEALVLVTATLRQLGQAPARLVDVGAGAGIAAMTLGICFPDCQVVAVEPRKLRAQFVAEAANSLQLKHLRTVPTTLFSAFLAAEFDLATARAVWPPAEWLPKGWPLLSAQGVAAVNGKGPPEALSALLQPLGRVVQALSVPGPREHAVALLRPLKG